MEGRCSILNKVFKNEPEVGLLEEFHKTERGFEGKITLYAIPKPDLEIQIIVPFRFPYSNGDRGIIFICENAGETLHVNADSSLCIHSPKIPCFDERLKEEIIHLKKWRDDYYIAQKKDVHYDYLATNFGDESEYLFTNLPDAQFNEGDYGKFQGCSILKGNKELVLIQEIDSHQSNWSTFYQKKASDRVGAFYFLASEPTAGRRAPFKSWKELEHNMSSVFIKWFRRQFFRSKNSFPVLLLIGYNIPNEEIHWQLLKINSKNSPFRSMQNSRDRGAIIRTNDAVLSWSKTVNASYDRFFGRGSLCSLFAEKKILLLGVGAIGSSLAKILTRTGVQHLDVSDVDYVEMGNLCRSDFTFAHLGYSKSSSVQYELRMISPFLNCEVISEINKSTDTVVIKKVRAELSEYDLIFDCTSDAELAYFLDTLKLKNTIINLTISNKAKEMICVVGNRNLYKMKDTFFKQFAPIQPTLIYEGTGCWSPTFEASYSDINSLLNLAVKNINHQYLTNQKPNNFVIQSTISDNSINLSTIDY